VGEMVIGKRRGCGEDEVVGKTRLWGRRGCCVWDGKK
jgi:hypothetical protein